LDSLMALFRVTTIKEKWRLDFSSFLFKSSASSSKNLG